VQPTFFAARVAQIARALSPYTMAEPPAMQLEQRQILTPARNRGPPRPRTLGLGARKSRSRSYTTCT
jgi:hypothetical protein